MTAPASGSPTAARKHAEHELELPLLDPRERAGADPRAGDRPDRQRGRFAECTFPAAPKVMTLARLIGMIAPSESAWASRWP